MLNQIVISSSPQATPRGAAVRGDSSTTAAGMAGMDSVDGLGGEAFGALLARQLQDAGGTTVQDTPAQFSAATGKNAKKTPAPLTAEAPAPDSRDIAAQTLATLMQANPQESTPALRGTGDKDKKSDGSSTQPDSASQTPPQAQFMAQAQLIAQAPAQAQPIALPVVPQQALTPTASPVATESADKGAKTASGITRPIAPLTTGKSTPAAGQTVQATPPQTPALQATPALTSGNKLEMPASVLPKEGAPKANTDLPVGMSGGMPAVNLTPASLPPGNPPNQISAPLGSRDWPDEFSQKISWISTQQNQVAELHLNPPDLGPMSVTLTITDNQATAQFSSPHLAVREAIENAMPKLRESLADNGIMLGNATVNDQTPRDSGANQFNQPRQAQPTIPFNTTQDTASITTAPVIAPRRHNGMVDTFA